MKIVSSYISVAQKSVIRNVLLRFPGKNAEVFEQYSPGHIKFMILSDGYSKNDIQWLVKELRNLDEDLFEIRVYSDTNVESYLIRNGKVDIIDFNDLLDSYLEEN